MITQEIEKINKKILEFERIIKNQDELIDLLKRQNGIQESVIKLQEIQLRIAENTINFLLGEK